MQKSSKAVKVYFITGENSGDNIAALVYSNLKSKYNIEARGVTGPKLDAMGVKSIFSIYKIAVMGFVEVIPKIFDIFKLINITANDIIAYQPDVIITIDSPDFCFRVIKKLRLISRYNNYKIIHIVAPSVWAYRENRAEKIAKLYDHLLCFLPFEPPYFLKHNLKASFVGHPIIEKLEQYKNNVTRNKNIIVVMPGSRVGEVKRHWPVILGAMQILYDKNNNVEFKVATNNNVKKHLILLNKTKLPISYVVDDEHKYSLFNSAGAAIVKSGTSSLEVATFNCPMVVVYKVNNLTAAIAKRILKIKFVSLVNIIAGKMVIPELLQEAFTVTNLANKVIDILNLEKNVDYSEYINKLKCEKKSIEKITEIIEEYI